MLKQILTLENVRLLEKDEQKNVLGGLGPEHDQCRLYINNPNGGGYWSDYVTYEQASSEWNGTEYEGGYYASGYCCASCAN